MKPVLIWCLIVLFAVPLIAQTTTTTTTTTTAHRRKTAAKMPAAVTAEDVRELRNALAAQQQEIQQLREELARRDQDVKQSQQEAQQAQAAATEAAGKAEQAASVATQQQQAVTAVQSDVSDLKANSTNMAVSMQETQKNVDSKLGKLSDLANGKVHIGATFYGDFTHYSDTGFGPQFYDNANQPGPGNSGVNVFEATRTYINLFYTPNDAVTLRITPDIYRQVDGTSGSITNGTGATIGSSENGNLTFRLKYAYVDFNSLFSGSRAFKKDKLTFGQTQNPLIDWEEGLSGYRYVYLMPWNYLSLSSTYVGAKLHGPIEMNGKEYLDYDLGVFTTASFHSIETSDKKQVMARMTLYPFGTTVDRTSLGFTVFENYGYNTKFPTQQSTALNRLALLAHYQSHSKAYEAVFEYDLGRNAFSTGNMFSGTAPVAVKTGDQFDTFNKLAGTILGGRSTRQQGFDVFGNARLGHSQFRLFGLYQYFQPNTHFAGTDPLDFSRTVGGVSYHYEHFDFGVGDENFHYVHPQGLVPGGDTNGLAIWTQYNY
ncbi:MAG: hypothetical protein ACRD2U_12660 [Terriglobales bacterium]